MKKTPKIYPTKYLPTIRGIVSMLIVTILTGVITGQFLFSTIITNGVLDIFIIYGIISFFLFIFVLGCFYLFTIKIIYINNDFLTIRYPLIFKTLNINLTEICDKYEQPFIIKDSSNAFNTYTVYEGKRIILIYDTNKKLEIDSYTTENYFTLKEYILKLTKSRS